ncbi:MAG: RNA pyrophosphohydrolase [Syntrophaceae bacterium PtaB.Bin038]|nr:MAG: RNA pyrophosphohydrolase [Syntrophaceae bacterium PtaB.Bin038]
MTGPAGVKRSAGLLLYRVRAGRLEVFLVHPGGPFWAKKDLGAWSIPKGGIDEAEDPLEAARREFEEETGFRPEGLFRKLEPVRQRSGKIVYAWAVEGDCDPAALRSNTFEMEWPPRSGRHREFPEVDRAGWFDLETANNKILDGQRGLLAEVRRLIGPAGAAGETAIEDRRGFMQYLVIGYDGTDDKAPERRLAVREAHLAGITKMKEEGKAVFGVAILNDRGQMIGSALVVDFPTRDELDAWLKVEPYVTGDVWRKIEVLPARVAPMFAK